MISKACFCLTILISVVFMRNSFAIEGISDSDMREHSLSSEADFEKDIICGSLETCVGYVIDDLYTKFYYAAFSENEANLHLNDPKRGVISFYLYLDEKASVERYEIIDKSGVKQCDSAAELVIRATDSFPYLLNVGQETYEKAFRKFRVEFPCGNRT